MELNLSNSISLRKKIISIFINIESYQSLIDKIIQLAEKRISSYVCLANVHTTIESYFDKDFKNIVNIYSR